MKKLLVGALALALLGCDGPVDPLARNEQLMMLAGKKPSPTAPKFSINDASCAENAQICSLTITKTGTARSSSVIRVRTVNGTAISGSDFTGLDQDVTFSKSAVSVVVNVPIIDNESHEDTESFRVVLTAGSNAQIVDNTGVITITDNDAVIPTTKVCPDGTVIPIADTCPDNPPDDPGVPDWEDSPNGTGGATFVAGGFDVNTAFTPSWGNGAIPQSAVPDVVGAFRFICGAGQLLKEDPIVYPGQSNVGHLHQFYGNTGANKDSTYTSLRTTGGSTCNQLPGLTTAANRSAYWMPAMLNGAGKVVQPDYVAIYYKRRPITDPIVSDPANPRYEGQAVTLPNGLKFIFGFDMVTGKPATGAPYFNCDGPGATQGHYASIPAAKPFCPAGSRLGVIINAPSCWDGTHLDSPNHRDHVAFATYGSWGYPKCPVTHPYVIPDFSFQVWYSVEAGDNLDNWQPSSDAMHPELPHGTTYHADFWMAWDTTALNMWHNGCINQLLNCSGGDMGNGKQLKGAAVPLYNGVGAWKNPNRLVDIP